MNTRTVIPAKAGIYHHLTKLWIPGLRSAPPGMTILAVAPLKQAAKQKGRKTGPSNTFNDQKSQADFLVFCSFWTFFMIMLRLSALR